MCRTLAPSTKVPSTLMPSTAVPRYPVSGPLFAWCVRLTTSVPGLASHLRRYMPTFAPGRAHLRQDSPFSHLNRDSAHIRAGTALHSA
jgi:hypothetical protein